MRELHDVLRPSWGSEKWILEGWQQITEEEKELIQTRMDELFKDGLPFELKHNKLLYIYTFSLLAQLEVLAIQVPLKFEAKMSSPEFKQRLHTQLLDEIFHGMVFTKIVYLLSDPYAFPPAYNENIELICDFIRNEECPKVAIMLLNLIGEGWIEEIFTSLERHQIAPKVFATIIADEHRHVCEADLYRDIGLPDLNEVREKLEYLEEQLLTNLFLQYKYMLSVSTLLGVDGTMEFMESLNAKHEHQLSKLNMVPSDKWKFFMQMMQGIFPKIFAYTHGNKALPMSATRQMFMTQWDNPKDPTMVGQFNVNVSCLDFFNKKFPPETLTTLMLQAISLGLTENDSFRNYLSYKQLYQSQHAYAGMIVQLPECGDHLGTIVFQDCHLMTVPELALRIRTVLKMMMYCFKKREELEKKHPHLKQIGADTLYEIANDLYEYPIPGNAVVSLSNIGHCGYSQTKSPLRATESMKVTLLEVERRQVWNKQKEEFEAQDLLPVSVSADHRIFDGNMPIPRILSDLFDRSFATMIKNKNKAVNPGPQTPNMHFAKLLDQILNNNLELGYKTLTMLQTAWPDFMSLEDLFDPELARKVVEYS
ncbi:MAG: hypothetical protein EPN84_12790 [Legionella sp.]|nr:MAG: hypothetical protein EPN84_12790 [Legionella sp.]